MKRNIKSIIFAVFFASMFVLGLVGNAQAQECSLETLLGDYLVTGRGDTRSDLPNPNFPVVTLAVWNFDGEGNVSGFATSSRGGEITRRADVTATYTLDSDCTGTFTFVPGMPGWELFVTRDGSEGATLNLNAGTIATRSFKRR